MWTVLLGVAVLVTAALVVFVALDIAARITDPQQWRFEKSLGKALREDWDQAAMTDLANFGWQRACVDGPAHSVTVHNVDGSQRDFLMNLPPLVSVVTHGDGCAPREEAVFGIERTPEQTILHFPAQTQAE